MIPSLRRSSRTFLPVEDIGSDWIALRGGGLRAVLECPTLAFGIKGEAEQRAVIDGWAALLNSLTHPLGIVIRSRRFDPRVLAPVIGVDSHAQHAKLRQAYARLIEELSGQGRVVDRRFFVVVPSDHLSGRRTRSVGEALAALDQRVRWVDASLRRLDLQPRRVAGVELAELLRGTVDPASAVQPIGAADSLLDAAELIAPAGVLEEASSLRIGDLRARALAVTRYPDRLDPGWLGALHELDGDLDVALHVHPNAGPAVMQFLERRIAELSSTVRLAEEHGARPDPYRQVALQDAVELQERIAHELRDDWIRVVRVRVVGVSGVRVHLDAENFAVFVEPHVQPVQCGSLHLHEQTVIHPVRRLLRHVRRSHLKGSLLFHTGP
ncbi:MAG: hypothetical protein ACYDHH_32765 [Solirubrobacteraceae bacterium]